MAVNDALDIGQPDARAFEFVSLVQPLEDAEQPIGVLHVEPDPVVSNREHHLPRLRRATNLDLGRRPLSGVLHGIGNEVEHDLAQQ